MIGRALIVALTLSIAGAVYAQSQSATRSCTAQWLDKRRSLPAVQKFDSGLADTFGRHCLEISHRVPIDWDRVQIDLAAAITTADPLVETVPADIDLFCSNYARATREQRRDFWRAFTFEVIKPEAGTNAHAIMWEQPVDRFGHPIDGGEYSVGLLQLSISNRHPYGCDIPTEASLLDPTRNVQCGAKIISYLVTRAGRIGGDESHGRVGLASYWSTIRVVSQKPKRSRKRETRAPILEALRKLPQCRAST